jgi:ABC transport system ATP-binding/permease protein
LVKHARATRPRRHDHAGSTAAQYGPARAPLMNRPISGGLLGAPAPTRPTGPARSPAPMRSPAPTRPPAPVRLLRIGRAPGNDIVVPDPSVTAEHAELRDIGGGRYELFDLGSKYGTFINGRRIRGAAVSERDVIRVGRALLRIASGRVRWHVPERDITLLAQDLTVKLPTGKTLLDHVTLPVGEGSLVAVLGPSGAGKSTLLGALTATRPATEGTVRYRGRDLYTEYAQLRHQIGLVPQENILHGQLSARRALRYAAGLRFPSSVPGRERNRRVDEVLGELGLSAHAQTRTSALSGGQQKRLNVAMELLTKPSLLLLDEPTSGLDPGSTSSVWEMMRELADDGRTVIVVTHEVAHLELCDRVLVLVPLLDKDGTVLAGGRVAYYGPSAGGLAFFGKAAWDEVFDGLDAETSRDWAAEFTQSPCYARYIADAADRAASAEPETGPAPRPRGPVGQFTTLCRRYAAVIAADRLYLAYMGLLPVVLGLTVRILGTSVGLVGAAHSNANAQLVLMILILAASLNGTSSSVEVLIKERPIYYRERAAGLSATAYLASKLVVLGMISVFQTAVLVIIGLAGRALPTAGVVVKAPVIGIPPALMEIWLGTAILAVASMTLGLLISAFARSIETVFQLLVGLTLTQVVMSGGARQLVGVMGLDQLSNIFPSRWAYGACAATVNLGTIGVGLIPEPRWHSTATVWFLDISVVAVLAMITVFATWWLLRGSQPAAER